MTPQELKASVPKFTENQWAFVHKRLLGLLVEASLVHLMVDHMKASANGEHAIPIYGQATTPMGKRQYSKLRMNGLVRFFQGSMPGYDKISVCWGRLLVLLEGMRDGLPVLADGFGIKAMPKRNYTVPLKVPPKPVKKRVPWPCKKEGNKV